jgi:hypothetical protein
MVSKIWPDNIGASPCYGLESGRFVKNVEFEPFIPDTYVKKAMVSQTYFQADDMQDNGASRLFVGYSEMGSQVCARTRGYRISARPANKIKTALSLTMISGQAAKQIWCRDVFNLNER